MSTKTLNQILEEISDEGSFLKFVEALIAVPGKVPANLLLDFSLLIRLDY
jgi:hypothetical protein